MVEKKYTLTAEDVINGGFWYRRPEENVRGYAALLGKRAGLAVRKGEWDSAFGALRTVCSIQAAFWANQNEGPAFKAFQKAFSALAKEDKIRVDFYYASKEFTVDVKRTLTLATFTVSLT